MNFEELIETRNARKTTRIRTPYGYFYKRLIDGRFSNFVEFHDELTDSLVFSKGVQEEYEATKKITDRHQLHFTPNDGDDGLFAIAVEVGHFLTIGQMLNDDPAISCSTSKASIISAILLTMCLSARATGWCVFSIMALSI